ncbi:MAG: InlB B-repeat-containing protein [Clostridia bacterium]|nr:InlB B-repeat-containing protein [Clostridia bacterium]
MKRFARMLALACVVLAAGLTARADTAENMQIVYTYLTQTLGLNRAAACGIMSNIQYESNFRPEAIGDSGNAYGICQWNSRRQSLINYCESHGFESWKDIYGQLGYLGYELEHNKSKVGDYLEAVPDSAQGAYDAGYYFCVYFEIPADRYNKGIKRGRTAVTKYYPMYGGTYETYTVAYNAQGGSGAPESQTKTEGVPLTLSDSVPLLPGYEFAGWATRGGALESEYAPGDTYTENRSVTLYAVWRYTYEGEFMLSEDEGGYTVIGYNGSLSTVYVPSEIDGKPVIAIDLGAFTGDNAPDRVHVPESVTYIEIEAFKQHTVLSAFPGSAAHLYALENALTYEPDYGGSLWRAPAALTAINANALSGAAFVCADLSESCVTRIESGAFTACVSLRAVALPDDMEYIAPDAFLANVVILARENSATRLLAEQCGLSCYGY